MKKALFVFSLLICGLSNAQEANFSLTEAVVRLLQSSDLTPSGKVFLTYHLETLSEMDQEMEPKSFSEMVCEEAALENTVLFFSPRKNCQRDLFQFLTNVEKSGEISASGTSTIGPDGKPVTSVTVGIKVTW